MRKPKILLVEENIEEAYVIVRFLVRALPCEVDVVFRSEEIENKLSQENYDFLIADLMAEGFDVDRTMKQLREGKKKTLVYLFCPQFDEEVMLSFAEKGVHFPVIKSARSLKGVALSIRNICESLFKES